MDIEADRDACDASLSNGSRTRKYFPTKSAMLCLLTIFAINPGDVLATHTDTLAELSLEQLAALPVISVSKTAKPISEAPASVFVITERNIRRSGATTLPEALRLAPNLQVARISASNYAVTARGFNNPFANKLLVMIDGRTVYSPLYSGVFWDTQNVVLEDLERIEVVSGPGGTLWGANAVNGVVNIVSRSAADTQGELLSFGGNQHQQHTNLRYGGKLAGDGHYRIYVNHGRHGNTPAPDGGRFEASWHRTQTGFRADWGSGHETFTLQGDAYKGRIRQSNLDDIEISGANVLARRGWEFSSTSRLLFQGYFDHSQRHQPGLLNQHLNTLDLELQHEYEANRRHTFMWGGGYRYLTDNIDNGEFVALLPNDLNMRWWNVFIQDEIILADNTRLTLGSKLEDNPFTGTESLPSAQLAWTPGTNHLIWFSWSRVVRSPSRIDRHLHSPSSPVVVNGIPQFFLDGGDDFVSEVAKVFELGFRSQPSPRLSWSITGFYSEYEKLRTLSFNNKGSGFTFQNNAAADIHGVELWGSWQVAPNWRLHGGLVWQDIEVMLTPGTIDLSNENIFASRDPRYYGLLRSSYDFSEKVKVDATLRHVDELDGIEVSAYTTLDINLAWAVSPRLELSLGGQNLLESQHSEFGLKNSRGEFERAFYGKLVWGL